MVLSVFFFLCIVVIIIIHIPEPRIPLLLLLLLRNHCHTVVNHLQECKVTRGSIHTRTHITYNNNNNNNNKVSIYVHMLSTFNDIIIGLSSPARFNSQETYTASGGYCDVCTILWFFSFFFFTILFGVCVRLYTLRTVVHMYSFYAPRSSFIFLLSQQCPAGTVFSIKIQYCFYSHIPKNDSQCINTRMCTKKK